MCQRRDGGGGKTNQQKRKNDSSKMGSDIIFMVDMSSAPDCEGGVGLIAERITNWTHELKKSLLDFHVIITGFLFYLFSYGSGSKWHSIFSQWLNGG